MDFRSFEHNFEVNAYIYERDLALKMKKIFYSDLERCSQVFLKEWKKRPRIQKFKESIMRMFSPLL
jgi:cardiolipin synthase